MERDRFAPRYHTSISVPVTGSRRTMRVIVTHDGVMLPALVAYLSMPGHLAMSDSWQRKVCHAVGLLYDYWTAKPPRPDQMADGGASYLGAFVEAMVLGTTQEHGEDPSGLYWPAGRRRKVAEVLKYLNGFTDWCAEQAGRAPPNPLRAPTWHERVGLLAKAERERATSFFAHLKNARSLCDGATRSPSGVSSDRVREIRVRKVPKVVKTVKYFPAQHTSALTTKAFRAHPRGAGAPLGWDEYNARDLMIVLLLRFGGLRLSEPFHLFVRDVVEDPERPGHARVLLYHPEEGDVNYVDKLSQQVRTQSRTDWLAARGLRPRSRMDGTAAHARWKNLMLEEHEGTYANVYWVDDQVPRVFWSLYTHYVDHVRPHGVRHPWLFCTAHGPTAGAPYPVGRFYENWRDALQRIGLTAARSGGLTPHGLRHAYAQDLVRIYASYDLPQDVVRKEIQMCLHHNSPNSQDIYTAPEWRTVEARLADARARMSRGDLPRAVDWAQLSETVLPALPYPR